MSFSLDRQLVMAQSDLRGASIKNRLDQVGLWDVNGDCLD